MKQTNSDNGTEYSLQLSSIFSSPVKKTFFMLDFIGKLLLLVYLHGNIFYIFTVEQT